MSTRHPPLLKALQLAAVPLLAILQACGSGTEPMRPPGPVHSVRFTSGGGQSDTVLALLAHPVLLEVVDSAGQRVPGERVSVSAVAPDTGYGISAAYLCTDATLSSGQCPHYGFFVDSAVNGSLSIRVQLGTVAGNVRVVASVIGTGLRDTITFTARPGAAVGIFLNPRDSAAYLGNEYTIVGLVHDKYGNGRPGDLVTFEGSADAATVGSQGRFRARAIGRAFGLARYGALVDTAWITVPPRGTITAIELPPVGPSFLVKVELDGSALRRLSAWSDTYYGSFPDWISPSEIVFDLQSPGGDRLYVADTMGSTRRLTSSASPTFSEGSGIGSPDGAVFFAAWGAADYGTALWKLTPPQTVPSRIGPNPPGNANAWRETVSPDGQRLAYLDVNRGGLSILDVSTGAMTPLGIEANMPRWSPNGDWIVFNADTSLYLVHPDGTGRKRVQLGRTGDARADWSPDGAWLIARTASKLELIDLSSGRTLPLGWSSNFIRPAYRR